jgi:hypothetical protein
MKKKVEPDPTLCFDGFNQKNLPDPNTQVMLHYYYGSKELLYESVLKYEGVSMLSAIFGENPQNKSPEEMLIDSPIRLMTVLHDNPQ